MLLLSYINGPSDLIEMVPVIGMESMVSHPCLRYTHDFLMPGICSLIDQSHRYGRPQAACREPVGSYDTTTRIAICFEHKTQYLLIRPPYICIVVILAHQ